MNEWSSLPCGAVIYIYWGNPSVNARGPLEVCYLAIQFLMHRIWWPAQPPWKNIHSYVLLAQHTVFGVIFSKVVVFIKFQFLITLQPDLLVQVSYQSEKMIAVNYPVFCCCCFRWQNYAYLMQIIIFSLFDWSFLFFLIQWCWGKLKNSQSNSIQKIVFLWSERNKVFLPEYKKYTIMYTLDNFFKLLFYI